MSDADSHAYGHRSNYTAAADNDSDDAGSSNSTTNPSQNDAQATGPMSPDVIANPWNTSLLWSSGVANNNDPNSNFYPYNHWTNNSIPEHLNTYPINYYFSTDYIDDYLNFDFSGHGLAILDFPGPNRSKYNVTIDNSSAIVDAYSPEDQLAKASGSQLPSSIWTSGTLSEGTHQVMITNLNDTAQLQFWGVVINPENYHAGKSFAPATSNIKLVTIAASVSAVVVSLLFILGGSIFYYFKVSRPRKRLEAQTAADGGDKHLLGRPSMSQNPDSLQSITHRRSSHASRPDLRLNMHFNSSQGDLGRVPSRATATTNESQFWVRPDTGLAPYHIPQATERSTQMEVQHTLVSPSSISSQSQMSLVSPLREFTERDMYATASPYTPISTAYHTAALEQEQRPLQQEQRPLQQEQRPLQQEQRPLQHSHSFAYKPSSPALRYPYSMHARNQSTPVSFGDPFQDPLVSPCSSPHSPVGLQRAGTRRPLPIPPALPETELPQPREPRSRIQIEQDAGSIHMSDHDDDEDPAAAARHTVLPPPYAPHRMGRDFA